MGGNKSGVTIGEKSREMKPERGAIRGKEKGCRGKNGGTEAISLKKK